MDFFADFQEINSSFWADCRALNEEIDTPLI